LANLIHIAALNLSPLYELRGAQSYLFLHISEAETIATKHFSPTKMKTRNL